jgi:hypothetical protein
MRRTEEQPSSQVEPQPTVGKATVQRLAELGYHRIHVRLQGSDGHLSVVFCDRSLLSAMLLAVRLTEKVEYELPIDVGATAVVEIGLLVLCVSRVR